MEKKVISCKFNINTACVEDKYTGISTIAICCPKGRDHVTEKRTVAKGNSAAALYLKCVSCQ